MAQALRFSKLSRSRRFLLIKENVDNDMKDIRGNKNAQHREAAFKRMLELDTYDDSDEVSEKRSRCRQAEESAAHHVSTDSTPPPQFSSDGDNLQSNTVQVESDASVDSVYRNHQISDSDLSGDADDQRCHLVDTVVLDGTEDSVKYSLRDALKLFACECDVTNSSLGRLLHYLKPFHPDLPKDPRTIKKGATKISVEKMSDGYYYNFGVSVMLSNRLQTLKTIPTQVTLDFNADGVQIFKSTQLDFWPILCRIREFPEIAPFPVCVFSGSVKPQLDDFFKDLVPELNLLVEDCLQIGSQKIAVSIGDFICDVPARSYVKGVKPHSGYYGCDRCTTKGEHHGRLTFPETEAPLRTDDNFHDEEFRNHKTKETPLSQLPIGLVSQFPLDVMHLLYLGVMRKLLNVWIKGTILRHRISAAMVKAISELLLSFANKWPRDFSRKPRKLNELDRWKATELRQFLLYLGPVVLKKYLSKKQYKTFMLLHTASTILCRPQLYMALNHIAAKLLTKFVKRCHKDFGVEFISYNVHGLIHVSNDSLHHGPIDSFSAFDFENALSGIKRLIKGKNKPLHQYVARVIEKETIKLEKDNTNNDAGTVCTPVATSRHYNGPQLNLIGQQYQKLKWKSTIISTKKGDNSVILQDSSVIVIQNFISNNQGLWCIGRRFSRQSDFYKHPYKSSALGINMVERLSYRPVVIPVNEIKHKSLLLPYDETRYVNYPLEVREH